MTIDQPLNLVAIIGITLVLVLVMLGGILYASYLSTRQYRQRKEQRDALPLSPPQPPPPPLPEPMHRIEFGMPYDASQQSAKVNWGNQPQRMDTDTSLIRCPICRQAITGNSVVRCAVCGTRYHQDCWKYVSGVCPNCRTR